MQYKKMHEMIIENQEEYNKKIAKHLFKPEEESSPEEIVANFGDQA